MAKIKKTEDSKELLALKATADELGVEYGATISEATLAERVEKAQGRQEAKETKKKPIKALNTTAKLKKQDDSLIYDNKLKKCEGNAGTYVNNKENFPPYKTAKKITNIYSKDFLDKKVRVKALQVKDGVYSTLEK